MGQETATRDPRILDLIRLIGVDHVLHRRDRLRGTHGTRGTRRSHRRSRRHLHGTRVTLTGDAFGARCTVTPARTTGARRGTLQRIDFFLGQFAEHAARQRTQPDRPVADTMQPRDRQSDGLAHLADLPEAALVDDQLDHDRVESGIDAAHPRRPGDEALVEAHTAGEPAELIATGLLREADAVDLLHAVARVHQLVREIAVVREQQQATGVRVETPDGVHARTARHELADRATAFGIVERRDHTDGLVEDVVHELRATADRTAVHGHVVSLLVDAHADLTHRLAIDPDAALDDELVTLPARADTAVRQVLVESHGHAGSSGVRVKRSTSSCCAGCSSSSASRRASSRSSYSNPGATQQPASP